MTKNPRRDTVAATGRKTTRKAPKIPTGRTAAAAPSPVLALEPPFQELHAAYVDALDRVRVDPVVLAKAEYLAVNDMHDVLTARADAHGLPPTRIRRVGGAWMVCYLQSDGSYGGCRPYTGVT